MNRENTLRHGSLFSGGGGFDLAAEWMGWENVFHCEINPFGRQILKFYWPKCISYEDIKTTDFTVHRGKIDILTGGFPCQPYSQAGKRLGKKDDRHLWPEMLRAIREITPEYIVGENVYGIINWKGGLVFEEVQADLENEGYEIQPVILPACGVNAPHRRDRVWFVACNTTGDRWERTREGTKKENWKKGFSEDRKLEGGSKRFCCSGNVAHSSSFRSRERQSSRSSKFLNENGKEERIITDPQNSDKQRYGLCKECEEFEVGGCSSGETWFEEFPTQSPICGGDDGLPSELDGITFSKWRNESIKIYGNAIVPQVAYRIFEALIT